MVSNCDISIDEQDYQVGETKNLTCNITLKGTYSHQSFLSAIRLPLSAYGENSSLATSIPKTAVWTTYSAIYDGNFSAGQPSQNRLDDEISQPVVAFAEVVLNPDFNTRPPNIWVDSATQCILSPCVRNYTLRVRDNVLSTTVLSNLFLSYYFDQLLQVDCFKWTSLSSEALRKKLALYKPKNGGSIWVSPADFTSCDTGWSSVSDALDTLGAGYVNTTYYSDSDFDNLYIAEAQAFQSEVDGTFSAYLEHVYHYGGLPYILPNVAQSITKSNPEMIDTSIAGDALLSQVFVHVRWYWLTLPSVLVATSIIFLSITIVAARQQKAHLWKNFGLAMLYGFRPNDSLVVKGGTYNRVSGMPAAAESTHVRLDYSRQDGSERFYLNCGRAE